MDRRTAIRTALAAGAASCVPFAAAASAASAAAATTTPKDPNEAVRDIAIMRWAGAAGFGAGTHAGTAITGDVLLLDSPAGQLAYLDPHTGETADFDFATWTSPWVLPGFAATEAIPSWTAQTPAGTWVQVELRGVTQQGATTKWYMLGRWADPDSGIRRTSLAGQGDGNGYVAVDTFVAAEDHAWTAWQLRITLLRPVGATITPQLRSVGAVASRLPDKDKSEASQPGQAQGTVLAIPQYSQNTHEGEYPEFDGGGEAWCSPTSTSMILAYWGTGPTPEDYAWVDPSYPDPWVDHAARQTFDYAYDGCGNWPFNTAYAGTFGLDGFVTRLRSLNEAEQFLAAGIPLVLSLSFKKNQIPGLDYGTNGHLLVLAGFDECGRPVLNDPAAPDNAGVRKVAGRAEFEKAWLTTSGGVSYVMRPPSVPLPDAPEQPNW